VHDALRRLVSTQDPAGRTIEQVWCACGSLDGLVDANRQRTTWERDVLGRVTREVRADGTTDTLYTYDLAGRVKTVTDPKDQVTTYTYALDDAVLSTVWTDAAMATPSVSYTYDPIYPRVATMGMGRGTTAYTYHPAGQPGAGQVASVDGPLRTTRSPTLRRARPGDHAGDQRRGEHRDLGVRRAGPGDGGDEPAGDVHLHVRRADEPAGNGDVSERADEHLQLPAGEPGASAADDSPPVSERRRRCRSSTTRTMRWGTS
jgi:YD repeat-containing protein